MNATTYPKATHVYIARMKCGCIAGFRSDYADKGTAADVAEFICEGYAVERITIDVARQWRFGCQCNRQEVLFATEPSAAGAGPAKGAGEEKQV